MTDVKKENYIKNVTVTATETLDDFIFEIVSLYLTQMRDVKILSKELLRRALLCFMEEHRGEYEQLIARQIHRLEVGNEADN